MGSLLVYDPNGPVALNILRTLVAFAIAYMLVMVSLVAVRMVIAVLLRLCRLASSIAGLAIEAVGLLAGWPFEWIVDKAETGLAAAADYRAQRRVWRTEFRAQMPWSEFRRRMDASGTAKRDAAAEAIAVLGLPDEFARPEMEARFRHLMQGVHPDKGGSAYLAQLLIAARNTILERKAWKR
jgi:hypothetical protein